MSRTLILLLTLTLLAGCGGRFAGFNNCSADGSTVWTEYPNSMGNYEGLNKAPCQ